MKTIILNLKGLIRTITFGILFLLTIPNSFSAIIPVLNLNDAGAGSLREAIATANVTALPPHTITFDVAGTITLTSGLLPVPLVEMIIAGETAPGFAPNAPVVAIDANGFNWAFFMNDAGANGST